MNDSTHIKHDVSPMRETTYDTLYMYVHVQYQTIFVKPKNVRDPYHTDCPQHDCGKMFGWTTSK